MNLDGLLTFFTILIAVYAVFPTTTRLRIAFRPFWLDWVSLIALIFVLYLEFFQVLSPICANYSLTLCGVSTFSDFSKFSPQQAAFLIVALWLILALVVLARRKINATSLPTLYRLASELASQQRYSELIDLVDPHVHLISQAASRKTRCASLHDSLKDAHPDRIKLQDILGNDAAHPPFKYRLPRWILCTLPLFAKLVPSEKNIEQAGNRVLRLLFKSPAIIEYVAMYRPSFGVKLLRMNNYGLSEFSDSFLKHLISTPHSTLYSEIRQNENISGCGYAYPEYNELLHFLFGDARNAQRLNVWRVIGEYTLENLRINQDKQYTDFLNGDGEFFEDAEKWRDPTFVALRFFDLMVTAAACQGVQWHMWLYYYPPFLKKLLAVCETEHKDIDYHTECTTRVSCLIYTIFDNLSDWVVLFANLPKNSPHRNIQSIDVKHENNNVPKSAALALGQSLTILLKSKKINRQFCQLVHEMILGRIERLDHEGDEALLRQATINALLKPDVFGEVDHEYGQVLINLWYAVDYMLREKLPDYELALLTQYGPTASADDDA